MKLAKTILACVVALALVGTMAMSALAAGAATATLTADKATAAIGDEIVVTVAIECADDQLASGKLPIVYDAAKVEFVSSANVVAGITNTAEVAEAGTVKNSFMFQGAAGATAVTLYTATFKAIADGEAVFTIADGNYATDAEDEDYELATAGCTVVIAAAETEAPTTEAPTTAEATTVAPIVETTAAPASVVTPSEEGTAAQKATPKTGSDASMAIVAGLVVLAGAAYVATKKSK